MIRTLFAAAIGLVLAVGFVAFGVGVDPVVKTALDDAEGSSWE